MKGQLVRLDRAGLAHPLHVAQRAQPQVAHRLQVRHSAERLDLRLVDGGNLRVERTERIERQVVAQRIGVEQDGVEVAVFHQLFHLAAIVGQILADAAELVVGQLEQAGQAREAPEVFHRNFDTALVAGIVVHVGPDVLEGGAHLDFEADVVQLRALGVEIAGLRDTADKVERHIAERVLPQQPPLVHRVFPIHFEKAVHQRGDLVDLVGVESDDPSADQVGDIGEGLVFMALEFQFPRQAFFLLDTGLDARDDDAVPGDAFLQLLKDEGLEPGEDGNHFPVFLQHHRAVQVESVVFRGHILNSLFSIRIRPSQMTVSMVSEQAA